MRHHHDYITEVKLKNNELPAKIDIETGEFKEIHVSTFDKEPKDKSTKYFDDYNKPWYRTFPIAWTLLETQTSDKELLIAHKLAIRAKAYTNSLEPLNPDSTLTSIATELNENKETVGKVIDRLFRLGVIGKFEVYNQGEVHQKYWVFNPFLSFNGKTIKKDVENLFSKTSYALIVKGS